MKIKLASAIAILILLASMFLVTILQATNAASIFPDYQVMDYRTAQAGLTNMPTVSASDYQEVDDFLTTPAVGTKAYDWYLRAISVGTPTGTQPYMTLRAISGNVEIWTQDYLWFPPGDPRNADPTNLLITDNMCQFVADEFNNLIYPTDTTYFGKPTDRDGTNTLFEQVGYPSYYWNWTGTENPQRVIIKVLNIRDTNYNNPSYPYYTAGFFSPAYDMYYNRNIIHIDAWRWWQRLGSNGITWLPGFPNLKVNRPFVYDSTITHEYQHLIHNDWNPSDPLFMNEGCSMYAEYLCNFGIDPSYLNSYLYTPDNSLTAWGDQGDINILADYGAAALWTIYLSDHYGGAPLLQHFVQAGIPGIDGVNAALAYFGYSATFDTVYHDWRIANLIRSDSPGGGRYNYESINLNDPSIIQAFTHYTELPVPLTYGTSFGNTITILGYDTGVSMLGSYSSDYINMTGTKAGIIKFIGDRSAIYGWTQTSGVWWSGYGNMLNTQLVGAAHVNPANPTLAIVTKYGLETNWDFGFVQVSTDNGLTWTSLANDYTTSDYLTDVQAIVDNLPGLTDYNPVWPDYSTMAFDLSAYSGKDVLINFRYMTDEATNYEGWFIQSATVSGIAMTLQPIYPAAHWLVSVVSAYSISGVTRYTVNDMVLDSSNMGTKGVIFSKQQYAILVISSVMMEGVSDYEFSAKYASSK